ASNAKLLAKAEALMAGNDPNAWEVARRDYLEPLLARSPEGEIAAKAQSMLDKIEMADTEDRLRRPSPLGRTPSPGEKSYLRARQYEDFGDPATAVAQYEKVVESVDTVGSDRAFAKLAARQIKALREKGPIKPSTEVLEQKLEDADKYAADGAVAEARRIWDKIYTLYQGHDGVRSQCEHAHRLLVGLEKPEGPGKTQEKAASSEK